MARVMSLWLAVSLAIGVTIAGAQGTDGTSPRLYSINGAVKAVSASSLALEVGDHDVVVLSIDSSTRVIGKGAGASDLLYRYGRRKLTDVIKAGDRVAVACRRSGRALTAVEVRVVTR
jgi:hypothetical protein